MSVGLTEIVVAFDHKCTGYLLQGDTGPKFSTLPHLFCYLRVYTGVLGIGTMHFRGNRSGLPGAAGMAVRAGGAACCQSKSAAFLG